METQLTLFNNNNTRRKYTALFFINYVRIYSRKKK